MILTARTPRRITAVAFCLGLVSALTAGEAPRVPVPATLAFKPHPRLDPTFAFPPPRAQTARQLQQKAAAILERGLRIPETEGNWIFYYRCPEDGAQPRALSPTEHQCPRCKRIYTDARTGAAYVTQQHTRAEREMALLARAYAATGEVRYARAVRAGLLTLAARYPTWTRHDRWGREGLLAVVGGRRYAQQLDEANGLIALARIYDRVAAAPGWTPTQRNSIEEGLLRFIAGEIEAGKPFVDPSGKNNHITWINAALATAATTLGDAALLRQTVLGPGGLQHQLRNSVTEDGIWYEGTLSYHFYTLRALMNHVAALESAGWDLRSCTALKTLWQGPRQLAYPDGRLPAINDGDPTRLASWKSTYTWAAAYFGDPDLAPEKQTSVSLQSTALRDIGLVALRSGGGQEAICAFLDYGQHGGHHGHPDKLNLMLYACEREVLPDPGRLGYGVPEYETWARQTVAHNTVVLNSRSQRADTGQLRAFTRTASGGACLCRSTGAYPGAELQRALWLDGGLLLDVFRVRTGGAAGTIDWLLHLRGALEVGGAWADVPDGALGQTDGYQHLTGLRRLSAGPAAHRRVRLVLEPEKRIVLHLATNPATQVFTGMGIGTRLNERVPFLLQRVRARTALFVTVFDLSGSGRQVRGVSVTPEREDRVRLVIETENGARHLTADFGEEAPGLRLRPGPAAAP